MLTSQSKKIENKKIDINSLKTPPRQILTRSCLPENIKKIHRETKKIKQQMPHGAPVIAFNFDSN